MTYLKVAQIEQSTKWQILVKDESEWQPYGDKVYFTKEAAQARAEQQARIFHYLKVVEE